MRILFTGATGVIGVRAVPMLIDLGHTVVGTARSEGNERTLNEIGAEPLPTDLFDPSSVEGALDGVDAVFHFATAIPSQAKMSRRRAWAENDRLRSVATDLLVEGARRRGIGRFVQESVTFTYADGGSTWLDETSPIDPVWDVLDSALAAEAHVARFDADEGAGVILRFSRLYGPGSVSGAYVEAVRRRRMPVLGAGANFVSSVHVDDAASAVVASLMAPAGTYNVTDDEPVTARTYTASLAGTLGVRPPQTLPRAVGRAVLGRASRLLTVSHRVSNARFRSATGWAPAHRTVVDGWRTAVVVDTV